MYRGPNRRLPRRLIAFLFLTLALMWAVNGIGFSPVAAQDGSTPGPGGPMGPISVSSSEPRTVIAGRANTLSVFGFNFRSTTTVRLVGYGFIETSVINSNALRATIPESIPPGQYGIEVSDPAGGSAQSPFPILVLAPTPTEAPPPTPVPGEAALVVRSFTAEPGEIAPGGTVTFTLDVANQGNRTAQGISLALDSGGKFVPARGQASVSLPDIRAGRSVQTQISAVAAIDAPAGVNTVPITLTYRDLEAKSYTSKANLTVDVVRVIEATQLVLSSYSIEPRSALPGSPVIVRARVTNYGNMTARQALIRVAGDNSVLLAGAQGNSFALGDISPQESVSVEMPLIVSAAAKPGPQSQPVTLAYLQDDKFTEIPGSITVDVARSAVRQALLLLKSYTANKDTLQPGDQFTLTLEIQNAGNDPARRALLTFGTVETTPPPSNSGGSGAGGETSGTSSTPSDTFAPVGTGGTLFVGDIGVEKAITLTQDFVINGKAESGIYNLPITLTYERSDGSAGKDTLRASLIVIAPPQLQLQAQSPIPESVDAGNPISLAIQVLNTGAKKANLTRVTVAVENGQVVDGAERQLAPINTGEDTTINATVIPMGEGPVTITMTVYYRDDFQREQPIVTTYKTQANQPPPLPTQEPPPPPTATPPPTQEEIIRRLILSLLGLGK